MSYYFSAKMSGFFYEPFIDDYKAAGNWPDDAIKMTAKEITTYCNQPSPENKTISTTDKGRPCWINAPAQLYEPPQP